MKKYNHDKIERKWQKYWAGKKVYKTKEGGKKPKCYVLDMFPYPSGEGLHVGHPRGYIATDVYSRFKRMNGFNVLHPMGFDSFGLPAENYAIKNKIHPEIAVKNNIKKFKKQLEMLGLDYDWDREIITSDSNFYKWTQWIFLKMFEKGLAYESYEPINWCPSCKTGLANEDLDGDKCERCETKIEQKPMRQWVLRITDYADRMLEDLNELKGWPEHIKEAQRNWIGRSEGGEIDFSVIRSGPKPNFLILHGYTGRADKNFIPRLKEELEKKGYHVQSPQMPNTDNPTEEEQVSFVLDNCQIDENTILIGHSLGGVVAMKVLQKHNKPIKSLMLVAPAVEPKFRTGKPRPFWKTFTWKDLNYERLKKLAGNRFVISDLREKERIAYLEYLAPKIDAQLISSFAEKEHFRGKEEPMILDALIWRVKVFTTRIDTIFGVTYLVVAPEHELIQNSKFKIQNYDEVVKYIEEAKNKSELQRTDLTKNKTGVELKGIKAVNPFNNEELPIFVADYVLGGYGTGAVMAVPAHDERDWEFAKKYNLPVKMVVCPNYPKPICPVLENAYTGEGHLVGSGEFNGIKSSEAREKMTKWLEEKKLGGRKINYKLRDWVFSRQRYWGEPIPLVFCENCNKKLKGISNFQFPISKQELKKYSKGEIMNPGWIVEENLPVKLPKVKFYEPTDTGESPLAKMEKWVNVKCPKCGGKGRRETNTMPQWAGSSWYYLAYIMRGISNFQFPISKYKKSFQHWMPIDMYVGGTEHATRHLIYARFWHKFLYDIGVVGGKEPFAGLKNQGLIMGNDGRKMSKRWGNIVSPDDIVKEYGADSLRLYEMFMGPFDQMIPWDTRNIVGVKRFLERVWKIQSKVVKSIKSVKLQENFKLERLIHKTIKKVTEDIENFHFNTAVSGLMILLNEMEKEPEIFNFQFSIFNKLLSPFAPHIAEELWSDIGGKKSIHLEKWPVFDVSKTAENSFKLVVQIDGKARDFFEVPAGISEDEAKALTLKRENVKKWVGDKRIEKTIYVPNKIISIVTRT